MLILIAVVLQFFGLPVAADDGVAWDVCAISEVEVEVAAFDPDGAVVEGVEGAVVGRWGCCGVSCCWGGEGGGGEGEEGC